ncbi:hypothetical protein IGK47_000581 [Enterococcus sp. AZ007]
MMKYKEINWSPFNTIDRLTNQPKLYSDLFFIVLTKSLLLNNQPHRQHVNQVNTFGYHFFELYILISF